MELYSEEPLRTIPANSKFLFFTDDNNRNFNRIAHFASNQCFAFIVRYPGNRV